MAEPEALETITLKPVPTEAASGASKALAYAMTIEVVDDQSYELAAEEVKGNKKRWQNLEETRVSFVEPLNKAVKRINDFFRAPLAALAESEKVIEQKMIGYRRQQQEKADAERRAREEAIRKAQLEAERLAREQTAKAEAEARRKREEEQRQREEAAHREREATAAKERELEAQRRGDAAAAAKARAEAEAQDKARREHEEAERKARAEAEKRDEEARAKAAATLAAAQAAAAVPSTPRTVAPTAAGTSARKKFKCEVFDKLELVKAIAAGTVPLAVCEIPEGPLNRTANALQGELKYPGVRVTAEESLAFRSGK